MLDEINTLIDSQSIEVLGTTYELKIMFGGDYKVQYPDYY